MVVPPTAAWSLYQEVYDDGDAEEKRETLLHRDELHGTPPETIHGCGISVKLRPFRAGSRCRARAAGDPPMDTTLSINDELNVAPARASSLKNPWRFPGEFLKIFCARQGGRAGHGPEAANDGLLNAERTGVDGSSATPEAPRGG